ncbi:MAG: hypothetical protein JRI44_09245, partial [Deltaproteobacteria bacterium]|nr:hypothetical protein [Deltaproteobacteria bacterium]
MIKGYTLDENVHQVSDMIASAADRPPMPLYKESMLKVDVNDMGLEITHPISPESINVKKELPMSTEVHKLLKKWFNNIAHESPKKIFLSLWRVLPQFLAENEKKLGPIWHLVPADTRTPDHSIWHHSSLVSALSICEGKPAFFIFSLAPVQGYIAEARKTKDLWIGSMVLSYLSWLGMKVIATDLGPDHIIYPSLRNQPIVDLW